MNRLTRRDFIKTASLMGGVSLFAGCSFLGDTPKVPEYIKGAPGVDPIESLRGIKNLFSVCAMCNGKCGICCRTTEGSVVKIGGNPYHPTSSGNPLAFDTPVEQATLVGASICAIGSSGIQTLYDPFRVARPLKRVGQRGSGKWKAIPWVEAISEITNGGNLFGEGKIAGLKANMEDREGLGFLVGNADWGALTFIKSFLGAFPGARLLRDDPVLSEESIKSINVSVFGNECGVLDVNYKKAKFLLNFGSAPLDSGVPLVSIARDIANARVSIPTLKWAVVDPRQSTSAAKADIWLPIIPGKDLSFALAVMKALFERFPQAVKFSNEPIRNAVNSHSVSEYANDAGTYEGAAIEIASCLAEAGPASAVIPGAGVYNQNYGREAAEAILTLNLIVGSVPGNGALSYSDCSFFVETEKNMIRSGEQRVTESKPLDPCQTLMIWSSDPVYSSPKATTLVSNTKDIPLVVAIDTAITETAAMADFILPDTTYLERWDICSVSSATCRSGFGLRSPMVGGIDSINGRYFPIIPETMLMEDLLYKFSAELNLGFGKDIAEKDSPSIAKSFYYKTAADLFSSCCQPGRGTSLTSVMVDEMFKKGGYFAESKATGKMEPRETGYKVNPLKWGDSTNSKVESNNDLLTLITYTLPFHRATIACINSWLLETLPENRLVINPLDASSRKLKQGDLIIIESSEGSIKKSVRIQIAPGIRPGVVALANGFGYRGIGATPYSIDKIENRADKPRSAGVNTKEFKEKGSLVRIRRA